MIIGVITYMTSDPTKAKTVLINSLMDFKTISTVLGWIAMLGFYFGVHKGEIQTIQNSLTTASNQIQDIHNEMKTLETSRVSYEQRSINTDKSVAGLDVRVTRIEDTIPKIAQLSQTLDWVKESIGDLKRQNEKIPDIQVSIGRIQTALEKSISK